MSWEWKELLRWNKKHFLSCLKGFQWRKQIFFFLEGESPTLTNFSHNSRAHISKSKRRLNAKSSTYYFHMKTKILADSQICISVPLSYEKLTRGATWKVSKHGVFSGLYFPVFSPNAGKYGPEKIPYLDTFHAVRCMHNPIKHFATRISNFQLLSISCLCWQL